MDPQEYTDDEARFVALLTSTQTAIALAVRGLMPGERAVEEVVQQTNAKIWQKRSEFQLGTNFRAWALAIARYEVLNFRKQQARDARLSFSDELEQIIAVEVSELEDDFGARQEALRRCLEVVNPESRALLFSRYSSEESLSDLAARIGRSVGGIKVSLSRLRSKLLECIEQRLRTEGDVV